MLLQSKIKRKARTIPFGYKLAEDTDYIEPIESELEALEEAKKLNPGMFVDTTTYNPIPENAPNMAADEIAKVIMGTGFLPEEDDELGYPEGMEKPMSSKLFIFEQYVIPQRKK